MLILPPFQGEGHGAQLLEAVHRFYCGLPKVQDITGERGFVFKWSTTWLHTNPETQMLFVLSFSLIWSILKTSIHLNVHPCVLSAEDPSENYVKLRDFVLSKLCQGLPAFAADKLPLGFSDQMVKEAQDKLKINKVEHHAGSFSSGLTHHQSQWQKHCFLL